MIVSQEQAERGIQYLYEDSSVREELIDEEAEFLLSWGEQQVMRLAEQEMDDAAFDEACRQLARLLGRMGHLAANRAYLSSEDEQAAVGRIQVSAAEVGLTPAAGSFMAQTAPDDIMGGLQALMTYVSSGGGDSAAATPPPSPPPANDEPAAPGSLFSGLASRLKDLLNDEEKPDQDQ
jgi:hypothetical protein